MKKTTSLKDRIRKRLDLIRIAQRIKVWRAEYAITYQHDAYMRGSFLAVSTNQDKPPKTLTPQAGKVLLSFAPEESAISVSYFPATFKDLMTLDLL